jgi:uncharacterized protein YjbI with pentapeptide repeats
MKSGRQPVIALGVVALIIFLVLIGSSFTTIELRDPAGQNFHGLLVNFAFSLFSIAGTVLVVDRLNEARNAEEERRRLVRDMSATNGPIAQRGANELREIGALTSGYLNGKDLSGASLSETHLESLMFLGGRMIGTYLENSDLTRADLSNSVLNSARASGATFEGAKLIRAQCVNTNFSRGDLNSAELAGGNFQGAQFVDADLTNADLRNGNFVGSNFDGAKLRGARCFGGKFDAKAAAAFGIEKFQRDGEIYTYVVDGPLTI